MTVLPPEDREDGGQEQHHVLSASDVEFLYFELLGRKPLPEETALQLAATDDWRVLAHAIHVSDEFTINSQKRSGTGNRHFNTWLPEHAAHTVAPGTLSPDEQVLVGEEGWIFLVGGTNAVLSQYDAEARLGDERLERWHDAVAWRTSWCAERNIATTSVIIPDKLPPMQEFLPQGYAAPGEGLAAQLVREIPGIEFPAATLSGSENFLRTDTHLTLEGATRLANEVFAKVGGAPLPVPSSIERLLSGDLGAHFDPPILEIAHVAGSLGNARLTADNSKDPSMKGLHLGTTMVLQNDLATDARTVVIFGDSYTRPGPGYQGLAWFAAQQFRTTHFVWDPFGLDPDYVERARADVVIFEMAERFVVRPPRMEPSRQ